LPNPIAAIIVVVAVFTAASAVVLNLDKVVKQLGYKRVAVLGERGVGKSHLLQFLATGSIPASYKKTSKPEKVGSRRFALKDLNLKLRDTRDLPGDEDFRGEWKQAYDSADLVLYLVRADRLLAGHEATEVRAREDLQQLEMWRKEADGARPRLFIIGTFCDEDPAFLKVDDQNYAEYADRFRRLPIMTELVARGGGHAEVKVVLGSMNNTQGTEALVYQLFYQVVS
jgi:hypothetical protein